MRIKILLLLLACYSVPGSAQNINEYKYVIIPEKFEFSKKENQHQLNALAKFLFEREGFETIMKREERPVDLKADNCLALTADVEKNSGLFVTGFVITLEDCQGNIVFTSEEGTSREKDFKTAWHEALREAFTSVEALDYNFDADAPPVVQEDVTEADKEIEVAAEEPEDEEPAPETPETPEKPVPVDAAPEASGKLSFVKDGTGFYLEDNENGYSLFQQGMSEPFAILVRSVEGRGYIYNSMTKQGIAYFTESGDLVVEHFDPSKNTTVKTTYAVEDQ